MDYLIRVQGRNAFEVTIQSKFGQPSLCASLTRLRNVSLSPVRLTESQVSKQFKQNIYIELYNLEHVGS